MKIKRFNENNDVDPYNEENWKDDLEGIDYLKSLNNKDINKELNNLSYSDDLDERMDIIDNILNIIQWDYEDDYDRVEDSIKDLAL